MKRRLLQLSKGGLPTIQYNGVHNRFYTRAIQHHISPDGLYFYNTGQTVLAPFTDGQLSTLNVHAFDTPYDIEGGFTHVANSVPTYFWGNKCSWSYDGGSKCLLVDNAVLNESHMSTPHDPSTMSINATFTLPATIQQIYMSPDGTKLYLWTGTANTYYYTMSTPFDITTMTLVDTSTTSEALWFSPDGLLVIAVSVNNVRGYTCSTPFLFSTRTNYYNWNMQNDFYGGISLLTPAITVSTDGKILFITDRNSSGAIAGMWRFDLSVAWTIGDFTDNTI